MGSRIVYRWNHNSYKLGDFDNNGYTDVIYTRVDSYTPVYANLTYQKARAKRGDLKTYLLSNTGNGFTSQEIFSNSFKISDYSVKDINQDGNADLYRGTQVHFSMGDLPQPFAPATTLPAKAFLEQEVFLESMTSLSGKQTEIEYQALSNFPDSIQTENSFCFVSGDSVSEDSANRDTANGDEE